MECLVEALLFVSDGPVAIDDLAKAVQTDRGTIEQAVQRLAVACISRGLRLVHSGARVQMVTAPEASPAIERLLGLTTSGKLSAAALETLAIVAYRQPITRAQVEAIRGVNSDAMLRSLAAKALIAPVGRLEQAGRPVLFATTFEFLQYFGIPSLEALPTLPELEDFSESQTVQPEPTADQVTGDAVAEAKRLKPTSR
jgi:segregation and condensation protein B